MLKSDSDVYAVIAPAIASQFTYAKLGQVLTGIKKLGFSHIIEAALGADTVSYTHLSVPKFAVAKNSNFFAKKDDIRFPEYFLGIFLITQTS